MLNFVLCDDNDSSVNRLSKMVESVLINHDLDGQVVLAARSAEEVLKYESKNPVDVLMLDNQLKSSMNGIDLAKKIREKNKNCYLIFTTAHLEYAILAYKLKTFDYLPKPLTPERLQETILRLFDDVAALSKTYLKIDNKNTLIDENEVDYIKRDGMKLVYHTTHGDYSAYSSFKKIQNSLPENFIRCHKSFIININRISNIDAKNNMILFMDNVTCEIGPTYKTDFLNYIKNKCLSAPISLSNSIANL